MYLSKLGINSLDALRRACTPRRIYLELISSSGKIPQKMCPNNWPPFYASWERLQHASVKLSHGRLCVPYVPACPIGFEEQGIRVPSCTENHVNLIIIWCANEAGWVRLAEGHHCIDVSIIWPYFVLFCTHPLRPFWNLDWFLTRWTWWNGMFAWVAPWWG